MTRSIRMHVMVAGLVAFGSVLCGCQTRQAVPVVGMTETSVKPGINAEFLKPSLVLTQWVERFEREGREIYTQRDLIVSAAKVRPGMTVADIGAGTGLFTPLLSQAVG